MPRKQVTDTCRAQCAFVHGGRRWLVRRSPSIFVSRRGLDDVTINRHNHDWGGMESDGRRYTYAAILAAEDGTPVRESEPYPDELTVDALRALGLVGPLAPDARAQLTIPDPVPLLATLLADIQSSNTRNT
jgi:hypothetical protein